MSEFLILLFDFLKVRVLEENLEVSAAPIFLGIPTSNLVLALLIFISALILHFCVRHWSARNRSRNSVGGVLRQPLHVIVWTFALGLGLLALAPRQGTTFRYTDFIVQTVGVIAFVCTFWSLLRLIRVFIHQVRKVGLGGSSAIGNLITGIIADGARAILIVGGFYVAARWAGLPESWDQSLKKVGTILLIGVLAWFVIRVIWTLDDWLAIHFRLSEKDNLRARQVHTQVGFIQKITIFFVVILSIASVLMLFEEVRRFGTTLLASAGLAGVVLGFAAQQTLSNLLAGLQLAVTQPIRLDDVVIVENEWGRIEEIALTFVVVALWDKRRLVVPISYFITKPFQNWTRTTAELLGSVMVYTDYALPIETFRAEAIRIIQSSANWDGKVAVIQLTDLKERTMEVRVLMSAESSSQLFDLRCDVREKIVTYLQREFPQALPQVRVALAGSISGS